MAKRDLFSKAVQAINEHGALLVYPIKNKSEPLSVWSELFPKRPMSWSWDEDSDPRVAQVWLLKEELSRSRQVVYTKWFKQRATFFSNETFVHLKAYLRDLPLRRPESRQMLELLESDSPLSTKQVKAELDLQGKYFESTYAKAQRELFEKLEIVGFGEIEDSAFPSMALGASNLIFEELCQQSHSLTSEKALRYLQGIWEPENPFFLYAQKLKANVKPATRDEDEN